MKVLIIKLCTNNSIGGWHPIFNSVLHTFKTGTNFTRVIYTLKILDKINYIKI